jgi:uncharacterized membrane protein
VVYTERSQAVRDLTVGLFGACFMSLFSGLGIWAGLRRRRAEAAASG